MSDTVSRARSAWRRWRELRWPERQLVVEALVLLPAVALALRIFGVRIVCGTLARTAGLKACPAGVGVCDRSGPKPCPATGSREGRPDDEARAMRRALDIAARHTLVRPTCLTRSVTLWWLLRRRGIESTVRIGVRTANGGLEAHAWVERNGEVLNDSGDVGKQFAPFKGAPFALFFWSRP